MKTKNSNPEACSSCPFPTLPERMSEEDRLVDPLALTSLFCPGDPVALYTKRNRTVSAFDTRRRKKTGNPIFKRRYQSQRQTGGIQSPFSGLHS